MTRRRLALALVLVAIAALVSPAASRWWRASRLLLALSSDEAAVAAAAEAPLSETELPVPGRHGAIRARLFRRADLPRAPGVVLAHGVHYKGIDDPRLLHFARQLSRSGLTVLTPELSDLTDYRITLQGADVISDSAQWLSAREALVTRPEVGVLGLSFAGGLALVAAARPELDGKLAYVTSVGGHHDLERVLRFLVGDRLDAAADKPHEYGLVIMVYGSIEHFVDEPDRETLRDAFRLWLQEKRPAAIAAASLRRTESGERLFGMLESGRLGELRPRLVTLMAEHERELVALSPRGHLADVDVPVYLLHGSTDSVIPPSESENADLELRSATHQALVSPLLTHVQVDRTAAIAHQVRLVSFMSNML